MASKLLSITGLLEDFYALIFPDTCLLCSDVLLKNEQNICTSCQLDLPVNNYHNSLNDNPVYNDLKIIENLVGASAYLKYHRFGSAWKLIRHLKYKGNYDIGLCLARWYASHIASQIDIDLIIPVPLHPSKQKLRGYNQSLAIAEGMQEYLQGAIDVNSFIRRKKTATQTKRNKTDRWLAMSGVFAAINGEAVTNKNILIVDDVITTGATIHAFCEEINKYQPKGIYILCIASGK